MKNGVLQKIVDILRQTGKISPQYTGKLIVTMNLSQGGVNDGTLETNEKLK
jgi:hypothetical protein